MHCSNDCTRKSPFSTPNSSKSHEALQDFIWVPPLSILEHDKSLHGFAAVAKIKNMNLGQKMHSDPEREDDIGSDR